MDGKNKFYSTNRKKSINTITKLLRICDKSFLIKNKPLKHTHDISETELLLAKLFLGKLYCQ